MRPRRARLLKVALNWLPVALIVALVLAALATFFGRTVRTFEIWFPLLWVATTLLQASTTLHISPDGVRLVGMMWDWSAGLEAAHVTHGRWFGIRRTLLVVEEDGPGEPHKVPLWLYGLRAEDLAPYLHSVA